MSKTAMSFRPLTGVISEPPGVSILAFAESMVVDVGNTRILEMAMHRPEQYALADEVLVTVQAKEGPRSTRMSAAHARAYAKGCAVGGPGGVRVDIGEMVAVVLEQHADLWREARRLQQVKDQQQAKAGG